MKGEEETNYKSEDIATGGIELPPYVQKLEDELKVSEEKRWELIHGNTALQNKLKASQEEADCVHQEMTSLEERLLPVMRARVRKMVNFRQCTLFCCV